MTIRVDIQDYGTFIEFPDGTPEETIKAVVQTRFPKRATVTPDIRGDEAIVGGGRGNRDEVSLSAIPGIVGGVLGGMAKGSPMRVLASGLLGAGGEAGMQLYQHATGSPNAPQTSEEAAKRIGITGLEQSVGQGAGEAILRGAAKVFPRVAPEFMKPGLSESEQTMRGYMEQYLKPGLTERLADRAIAMLPENWARNAAAKPGYTIAQKASPLSTGARAEQIVEHSFFGATPIKRFKWAQEQGLEDWARDISEKVWRGVDKMPPSERGKAFTDAFDAADGAFRSEARAAYGVVDEQVGKEVVDVTPLKTWATEQAKKNAQFAGIGSSQTGDSLLSRITNLPDNMKFSDAIELRSRLLKEGWQVESRDVARAMSSKATSTIDKAMEEAATKLSPDAHSAWREANAFYRKGKDTFDNEFMRGLVRKGKDQPELVGKSLFQNGEITQIKKAKDVLGSDVRTWQNMKAGWLDDVITKATKEDGSVAWSSFFGSIKNMGNETLHAIFSPKELMMIRQFDKALSTTQKLGSAGGGSILIQLMQAGPLAALAGAGATSYTKDPEYLVGGLTILLGPRVFANMFVNPKYHSLFMKGLNTSKPRALPVLTKLAAGAYETQRRLDEYDARNQ